MVRLRQLAVTCNLGANLEKELLRAFVFGCGIEKVEELMSSNDSKTLKDAIECGLKNEYKLEDLKQIRSAYSFESAPTGGSINHTFSKQPTGQSVKNCGWCGREQHDRANCPAKDKDCKKCGTLGHFANVCRKTQTNSGNKCGHHTSQGSKSSFAAGKNDGRSRRSNAGGSTGRHVPQQGNSKANRYTTN